MTKGSLVKIAQTAVLIRIAMMLARSIKTGQQHGKRKRQTK
jgi:hypothetical protein